MNLLDCLNKEELKNFKSVKVKKGHILFSENDKCEYVGIVKKGTVQIISYTLSGQEILYNEIEEKGMFGNNLLFSSKPLYKGNVIAKSDSEILLINEENLVKTLQNNAIFLKQYLLMQSDFSKKLNQTIKLLSIASADERLLFYIEENEPLFFDTVSSLAQKLFLSREALSRTISKLIKAKRIYRNGNQLSLVK